MQPVVFFGLMIFAYLAVNYLVMDLTMRYLLSVSAKHGRPVTPDWSKSDRFYFETMAISLKNAIVAPIMCLGLWLLNNSGYAERVMSDDVLYWLYFVAAVVFCVLLLMYRTAYAKLFGKSST